MSVYNATGDKLNVVYSKNGDVLNSAYSANGQQIFPDIDPTDYNFKVMSFNNQSWTGLSGWSYIGSAIENYDADIIGTQESHSNTNLTNLGYVYTALGSVYGVQNIVFSKHVLSDILEKKYDTNRTSGQFRTYQKMYFTFNGKTIAFFNTHLETSGMESYKVAQAQELFEAVQNEESFIITGDFNTVCKSVNDTEYTTIMKQFVDAGYNVANCSPQWGFNDTWTDGTTASGTWYPCDHIITSSDIQMSNVVVDRTKVELDTGLTIDHLPIIAYLKIT